MRAREKKPGHDRQENPPPMEPATDFSGDNSRDYGVEATEARAVLRLLAKCCSATGCPNSLQTGILQGVGGGQPTSGRRRSFSIRPRRSGSRAAISLALPLHEKVGHSFPTFSPRPVPCRTVMYRSGACGACQAAFLTWAFPALRLGRAAIAAARYRCIVQAICPWRNPLSMMRSILSGAGRSSRHERGGHGRGRTVLRRATKGGQGSEPFSGRFGSHIATGQFDRLCRFPARHCRRTTGGSEIRPLSLFVRISDGRCLVLFACTSRTGTCRGATWRHWPSPANGKDPYHFLHTGTWKGASCDWPLPQRRSSEWRGVAPRSPKDGTTFVIFDEGSRTRIARRQCRPSFVCGNRQFFDTCRPCAGCPMAKPTQYDAEHPEWRRAVEPTRTGRTPQRTNRRLASDERRPKQRAVFRQVQQPLPQPVNLASRRLHALGIPLHFAHGNVPDSVLGMARCRTAALPSGEAWRLAPQRTGRTCVELVC